jgi:serine/threonine protein kinase
MTESITALSRTHGLLLTPEYAAPEQWRGTPATELDGRTDLYALGGVLYEMLTGRTPFHAANPEGWMYQHLQGALEPISKYRPEVLTLHPGLEQIVMRLLARERESRFSSSAAFIESLTLSVPAVELRAVGTAIPVAKPPSVEQPVETLRPPVSSIPKRDRGSRKPIIISGLIAAACFAVWIAMTALRPLVPADAPVLSPAAGTYSEPQTITISDRTPGATIHYTLDGTSPTPQSPTYSQPIGGLHSGSVVRAMATAPNRNPSADVTGVYIWTGPVQLPTSQAQGTAYEEAKDAYNQKNYSRARELFAQSCDSGEMRACNYLGYLYAQGLGGPRSEQQARAIYDKACSAGNMSSCASLGSLYQDSHDKDQARKYFQQACSGGLKDGCDYLHAIK